MKRTKRGTGYALAVIALAPLATSAQQASARQAGPGRGGMAGVEQVMRMRERLGLTEDQIRSLEELRNEAVQRRNAHQATMQELRSKVMAGEADRGQLRELARAHREQASVLQRQQRERIEQVLTEAQRDTLRQVVARARAFRMGRESAMRGQGMRGGRGMRPGMRGGRGGPAFRGPAGTGLRRRGFGPGVGDGSGPGAPMRRPGPGPGVLQRGEGGG